MSTYTCPHCGQHDLSTQRRHNCPKPPSLSIPLGPPRSRDPIANEHISRLTRELEEARKLIRELVDDEYAGLVWLGKRIVCAYCGDGLYSVSHDGDCPIVRARRALAKDTEGETRSERCRPGESGGLRAIFGRWPGDETDEEIQEWLERES